VRRAVNGPQSDAQDVSGSTEMPLTEIAYELGAIFKALVLQPSC
jgi:hypothetical protein